MLAALPPFPTAGFSRVEHFASQPPFPTVGFWKILFFKLRKQLDEIGIRVVQPYPKIPHGAGHNQH
jgi:hypothetical protein